MKAVLFEEFGPADKVLRIVRDAPEPVLGDSDILIEVKATSVNPIDCAVRSGYGSAFFLRNGLMRMPLIPGRDIAGIVNRVGEKVTKFKPGDAVYAGVPNFATAALAGVNEDWVASKPTNLTFAEAAALPYAALTAWTALVDVVGLSPETARGKRIIIPRGAGGVGSFAIQLMKAWGAHVASICSTRNVELVKSLGADVVVDYTKDDFADLLQEYDVAFDTAFDTEEKLLGALKTNAGAHYVSIVTPRFQFIDKYGLDEGQKHGDAFLAQRKAEQEALGRRYDWCFMRPNGEALAIIAKLVEAGQIRPVIDSVYTMENLAEAHQRCETKQARGKIVIDVTP
ncbi:zinc-binding dehydrogenase [Terricaulis silvestris]|uniref:Zinc-type alcohol dehydrogenase-like protein n=1 Tax=Terricaulis silvestris TaxID=2686094 RepID=A0A6I6MKQ7_9CAUL|nr:zinc-binding dehydrogenase [Terricaulis silvestris]QGZ93818.1 Zinc-type alcohol dehydrogenase-like protein [Terricaulis silvestris]